MNASNDSMKETWISKANSVTNYSVVRGAYAVTYTNAPFHCGLVNPTDEPGVLSHYLATRGKWIVSRR